MVMSEKRRCDFGYEVMSIVFIIVYCCGLKDFLDAI